VIKKSFSATHLRRGYDETQVDDFLDEVVVELRRLLAENDSLRSDLEDCRASRGLDGEGAGSPRTLIAAPPAEDTPEHTAVDLPAEEDSGTAERTAELTAQVESLRAELASCQEARARLESQLQERSGSEGEGDGDGDGVDDQTELEDLRARITETEQALQSTREQLVDAEQRAEAAEARAQSGPEQVAQGEQVDHAQQVELVDQEQAQPGASREDPTAIIALAQRLHAQHVAEGESTRDALVGEAEAYRDRITSEAEQTSQELTRTGQETHDRLVTEGQDRHDELVRTGEETRDRLVEEGESRSQELVGEAEQRRSSILEDLTSKQGSLTGRIDELRTQESDLRDRLRTFLTDQLSKVESRVDDTGGSTAG
jgi:DivIVA domain-containing protein